MKVIRCDTNVLVLRRQNRMLFVSLAIGLLAIPAAVWALPQSFGHEQIWALVAFLGFGPALICFQMSYEDTYAMERNARRILILRKFVARRFRRELDFDQIKSVEVRMSPKSAGYVAIVLNDGSSIDVVPEGIDARSQRRECQGTAALLRDILGLAESGPPATHELQTAGGV